MELKPINLLSIKGRITGHDIITRDLEIRDWEGYPTVRIQGGSSNGITIYRPSTFDPAIELMSDPNYENFLRISDASSNNAAILLISHREKHHENYNAVILADTRGENAFILKGDDIQNFLSIADKQDNDSVAFKAASIGGKSAVMNLSIKRNGKDRRNFYMVGGQRNGLRIDKERGYFMNELVTQQQGLAISTETKELIQSSIADSTLKRYQRLSKQIEAWLNGQILTDGQLADYITELHTEGKSPCDDRPGGCRGEVAWQRIMVLRSSVRLPVRHWQVSAVKGRNAARGRWTAWSARRC